jgi:carboxylesterase
VPVLDEQFAGPKVVDPGPFDLPGSRRSAALCLHGLTGTPYEVRPLGEAISTSGIRAVGPVLPGHRETPEKLATCSYTDWLEAARKELAGLRAEHKAVSVVGLSMGGLLALALAAEEEVDAVVVVGVPLVLRQLMARFVPVMKYLRPMLPKTEGSDIRDEVARSRHPGYDRMPLRSVHELQRLQKHVIAGLPRVTAPILIAHGMHDRVANPADAAVIRGAVSSEVCEYLLLASSGHVAPVDFDGPALSFAVAKFINRYT